MHKVFAAFLLGYLEVVPVDFLGTVGRANFDVVAGDSEEAGVVAVLVEEEAAEGLVAKGHEGLA